MLLTFGRRHCSVFIAFPFLFFFFFLPFQRATAIPPPPQVPRTAASEPRSSPSAGKRRGLAAPVLEERRVHPPAAAGKGEGAARTPLRSAPHGTAPFHRPRPRRGEAQWRLIKLRPGAGTLKARSPLPPPMFCFHEHQRKKLSKLERQIQAAKAFQEEAFSKMAVHQAEQIGAYKYLSNQQNSKPVCISQGFLKLREETSNERNRTQAFFKQQQ
ncbi:uncharacterized protein LOC133279812 [Pezoporus flaviventris]|uniref:uncharacterized protein LOC133279812 n=1 Tax=Pezoporus flaviventris TaxID=889875 RepID=UPI002AB037CD|nr:uncharacterized protein LOC133279812 [Pezoporus flaviventris]